MTTPPMIAAMLMATAVALCGCNAKVTSADGPLPLPGDPLWSQDGRLYDATGREVLLRGVNARVAGLFDVVFDDGRTPLEPIPPFGAADCSFLKEELGLNFLRLPVNWSGIEPQRGRYDEAYLDRVAALAETCAAVGVQTLVDLHQDAYGKDIGEDGAPLWAIVPPPDAILEGPLEDLGARRVSPQVLRAFESFYNNVDGLQDAYAGMAAHVAARTAGVAGVIGLEIQNEPVLFGDFDRLDAFHARVAAAVRAVAPDLTLFFEPNSLRNMSDESKVGTAFPFADAVYAPHLYTGVFQGDWERGDVDRIRASAVAMRAEAEQHGAALVVGEFGNSPHDVTGAQWLAAALDVLDEARAGWAFWVYEEWSQGSWGLYDAVTAPAPARIALRANVADQIARMWPRAVAGRLVSVSWDDAAAVLQVGVADATDLQHEIAVPARRFARGVTVRCDGVVVAPATPAAGVVSFPCRGERIEVRAK